MVRWSRLLDGVSGRDGRHYRDEFTRCMSYLPALEPNGRLTVPLVLPSHGNDVVRSAVPAQEVTKVAMRLKYQIEQVIPIELEEDKVTRANSPIITKKVLETARNAGGKEYRACVVYCLLVCLRWFKRQAMLELWDSDLHNVRAKACEMMAKHM